MCQFCGESVHDGLAMMNHIKDNHQNDADGSDDSVVSCDGRDGSIVYDTDCSCGHIMEDDKEIVENEVVMEVEIQEMNDEGEEVIDISDENTDDDRAVQVVRQIMVEIVMNEEMILDI